MMSIARRQFLATSVLSPLAASFGIRSRAVAADPLETVRVALIGCGSQGNSLAKRFQATPNAQLVCLCDVDQSRRDNLQTQTQTTRTTEDLREVLEDRSIDAVIIATPDHWHTPAAILAMKAGKHVYVEKPCCQNYHEGVLLNEVAKQTNRVFQHGTQFRSDASALAVIDAMKSGLIGEVFMSKAWNVQRRKSIGHEQPTDAPAGVNYDLWVGPAEYVPFQQNRFHYNWRWWYNFGSGDMGNDGIHELDLARWGLGVESLPNTVSGVGGKYYFDDDQQFPDTMTVAFEYTSDPAIKGRRTLIYEQRLWSTNYPYNVDSGVEFYGTKGKIFVSKRGKLEVLGERNAKLELPNKPAENAVTHYQDFVDAIRNSRATHAGVETAFRTAALSHLGNISVRLGRSLTLDSHRHELVNDAEANQLLQRRYRENHFASLQG